MTKNDPQNLQTALIPKKAGMQIRLGDRVQVRNPDGTVSEEFIFTVPQNMSVGGRNNTSVLFFY